MEFIQGTENQWLTIIQGVGIIGGLIFTAVSLRFNAKVRRVENLILLTAQHRKIWKELFDHNRLTRILKADINIDRHPVTVEEERFTLIIINHLHCSYFALKAGVAPSFKGLRKDIKEFFAYPIPQQVWRRSKQFQNRDFVKFVEKA
jgi:hypothetical protein